jgi:hypothetical protein
MEFSIGHWESPLRNLAQQLRDVAKAHIAHSQVIELMQVVDGYINAMALIEETNRYRYGKNDTL